MTGTIGKAVVVSKQNHSVAGIRTLAAGRTMVKGSSCAESGPHASLHSGSTHQQVLSTSHDNNNSSMHVDSAPAAAAPSQQPASPESVNDGQATPAPAPKSPSLPANTQNNVSTKDVVEGAEGVPDPAAVQAAAVPPAPAQRSPTPVEPSEEAAKVEQTLEPLPAPNASEDAEVHAEYEVYLARWRAGTTLRQRWHRCGQPGCPFTTPSSTQLMNSNSSGHQAHTAATAVAHGSIWLDFVCMWILALETCCRDRAKHNSAFT